MRVNPLPLSLRDLHLLQHLVGSGADGLVGVAVAQKQAHPLRRLAPTDPGSVQGHGHLAQVHLAVGVGLEGAGVVPPFPIPWDGKLHLAKSGLRPPGVVALTHNSLHDPIRTRGTKCPA